MMVLGTKLEACFVFFLASIMIFSVVFDQEVFAQTPGTVLSLQKISDTEGNFTGVLDQLDEFGIDVASLGDLNGDGKIEVAVGAYFDDDDSNGGFGTGRGAVWILSLNSDGTVFSDQKISDTQGNFTGGLFDFDSFGRSVANIGDLDNNGVVDIAVTAAFDDDGGSGTGSVWILFLNSDGTVKSQQKISEDEGGLNEDLTNFIGFGSALDGLGDLNNDGVEDIVVGVSSDGDGGDFRGSVWILFLNNDGTVKNKQKISSSQGNFTGVLDDGDSFGIGVANISDLDEDGVIDLAVGAVGDDDGGTGHGAVWILFLNSDGTVKSQQKISELEGGFVGPSTSPHGQVGVSITSMGDLDGDGVIDLAVGSGDDSDANNIGAVWMLFMNKNGTVKSEQKISNSTGNFSGVLEESDLFSRVANLGDLNGDGINDLAVGTNLDDDGFDDGCQTDSPPNCNRGAVWVLFLHGNMPTISCDPPEADDWVVLESCEISSDIIAPASVMIQNNAVVIINSEGSLTVPSGENVIVIGGSGLKLIQGSSLNILS